MNNERMTSIEAKIIKSDINMIDNIANLLIDIKGKQYILHYSFKSGNHAFFSQLRSNMFIKFKGIVDNKNREILYPQNIWIKIS